MGFKDHVAQDIKATFINTDEFGDGVNIDGRNCDAMIDSDRLIKRAEKEYGGVTVGLILYFIAVSDYPGTPKVGNTQNFNHKLHLIDSVSEIDGVYEIIINQNRGE